MLLASCRSSKSAVPPGDGQPKGGATTELTTGDWSKLDIKLTGKDNKRLYQEIKSWLGTPYQYAGETKQKGADCSGFTMMVYKAVYGVGLARNSAKQLERNCKKIGKDKLSEGDLVFFATGRDPKRINHVGIYLRDGYFAHASSSRGVVVTKMSHPYWEKRFVAAGRVTTQ